jgi:hypothetical protein
MLRPLALVTALIALPLSVNAECARGYTQLSKASPDISVCQLNLDPVEINDNDPSIIYTTAGDEGTGPTWFVGGTASSNPKDYMNDEHFSNFSTPPASSVFGAALVVNFTGTDITWIGKIGPNFGIANYLLDGGLINGPFDAYNPTLIAQNNNVVISGLPAGPHSLKIEVTQNKNASSSDYYQVIDAFNITGSPLTLDQGSTAGYNSPALAFSGPWTCGASNSGNDLSGGHCYSNVANASISWTFTGSLIEVFGRPDLENGIFKVLIDGALYATIDGHFGTADIDELNGYPFFQGTVPSGTHTITIVNTGTRDPAATNTFVQIDLFVAFQ